ncbi:transposase [Mesorhizobium sp. M0027]
MPRKHGDDCLGAALALRPARSCRGQRRSRRMAVQRSARYPRLTTWVEETIEYTLTFFRLPRQHHKHLKSTNMLERLNEEIRRRTYVVRIFPNSQSCLRLVRALAVETNENWMEANR